jgi:hypothetical protein
MTGAVKSCALNKNTIAVAKSVRLKSKFFSDTFVGMVRFFIAEFTTLKLCLNTYIIAGN